MAKRTDFSKMCRTCLLLTNETTCVFSQNIFEMIKACSNIKISELDGLPSKICTKCIKNVKISFNFKNQVEKCDKLLRKIVQDEVQLEKEQFESIVIKSEIDSNNTSQGTNEHKKTVENEVKEEPFPADVENSLTRAVSTVFSANDSLQTSNLYEFEDSFAEDFTSKNSDNELSDSDDNVTKKKPEQKNDKIIDDDDLFMPIKNEWKCEVCGKQLCHKNSMERHMKTHPNYRTEFINCSICGKQFYDKMYLDSHMLRHTKNTKYNCEHCEKSFYALTPLAYHIEKHHHYEPVECKECKKKFTLQLQLNRHMATHRKEFICNICGKQAKSLKALCSHRTTHNTDPFPCAKCERKFKYKSHLYQHVKSAHMGIKKGRHVCTICGNEVVNLKHHMIRHATEKPFKCERCDKSFAKEWALKQHSKNHTGFLEKYRVLCTVCGKKIVNSTALRYHMRIHTGEEPFKCTICDKTFKRNSTLLAHKRIHTGERLHECTECHKDFATKHCLELHKLIHTGERPHECNFCGRRFTQKSALKTHMTNLHKSN